MLFNNNDGKSVDRAIYKTKPNLILGCKKAIFGVIILILILIISPMVIRFIGEMQVYLISYVKLSLTRYAAIGFFVIILVDVIYIIWQLVGWYSMEYTLTDTKIIIKSGVLSTKKNYMPYATIQDINTSQGVLSKIFNVGTVSVFSAYDNNRMELKNVSNPSEVEEIIFSRMVGPRNFQAPPERFPQQDYYADNSYNSESYPRRNEYYEEYPSNDRYYNEYQSNDGYYDEYEPITPITHERNVSQRREYEYYPEDFPAKEAPRHKYEYEPYDAGYSRPSNNHPQDDYYNQPRDDYSYSNQDYYQNNDDRMYYDEYVEEPAGNDEENIDASSQRVIKRHFDKFKK